MLRWKILQAAILLIGVYNVMTSIPEHKDLYHKMVSCDNIWQRVVQLICNSKCIYDLWLGIGIFLCMTLGLNLRHTLEDFHEWIFYYSCLFPLNSMILAMTAGLSEGGYLETMDFSWVTIQALQGVLVLIYINHLEGLLALEENMRRIQQQHYEAKVNV